MNDNRRREFEFLLEWVANLPHPKVDYAQMPASAFLGIHFYHRLLIHQTSYSILLRTFAVMAGAGLVAELVASRGGLSLEEIIRWGRDLDRKILFEAYCTYPHRVLIGLMADLKVEGHFLRAETQRRLADKPLTQEFIRLDWLGETPLGKKQPQHLKRLLKVDRLRSYRPREQADTDVQQSALLKALELWRVPSHIPVKSFPLPTFPLPRKEMLPDEQAFWDGPMAQAWEAGRQTFLDEVVPVLTGEKESIPQKVREHLRNEWATLRRRERIFTGTETFPEDRHDRLGAVRADWDFSESALKNRHEDIATQLHSGAGPPDPLVGVEIERVYRMAQKRLGKRGHRFVEALMKNKNVMEASAYAGVSRQVGHKYLQNLKKSLS